MPKRQTYADLRKNPPNVHVPLEGYEDKPFQKDLYNNFRIVVEGKSSEWMEHSRIAQLDIEGKHYIAVMSSLLYKNVFPSETVIEWSKAEVSAEAKAEVPHASVEEAKAEEASS